MQAEQGSGWVRQAAAVAVAGGESRARELARLQEPDGKAVMLIGERAVPRAPQREEEAAPAVWAAVEVLAALAK